MGHKADVFEFKGAKALSQTISGTALSDKSDDYESGAVRLTCTAHGYLAGSLIYLSGFVSPLGYLNGLKKILAVATNTFDVAVKQGKYAAGTPGGTETARVGITLDESFSLESFEIHLNAASATEEDIEIAKDGESGSQFDFKSWDRDMNGEQDKDYRWDPPPHCNADDVIVATWANTNSKTWGIKWTARRHA